MREENIKAAEAYINALKQKDLSLAPFADDIVFEDPIAGKQTGAENFRTFLTNFLPAINDIKIIQHISEDDWVVTHWEVDGVFGIVPILEKFRMQDGKITEAFGLFDPRPILG